MRGFSVERIGGMVALPMPDYVDSKAFTTHEEFTVPAGALYALISGTVAFYMLYGTNPTAAVPADVTDGTASELVNVGPPILRQVVAGDKISVVASGACITTIAYYGKR